MPSEPGQLRADLSRVICCGVLDSWFLLLRTGWAMSIWTDGTEWSPDYEGTDLQRAIGAFFGDRNDAELERLKADNALLRMKVGRPLAKGASA